MDDVDCVDILMTAQTMPVVEEELDRAFHLHRLWESSDPSRSLRELSPRVRGIALGVETRVDEHFLDRFPRLEIISTFGVGYDHIDVTAAARRGVIVTNTPGVLDDEVADTCIGLLLSTIRELPNAERFLRAGRWKSGPYPLSSSLRDRRAGVVGLGRIGRAVARRLEPFSLPIYYHGRKPQPDVPYTYCSTLLELAREVDILICTIPGGPSTRHLISSDVFNALGQNGIFINIGRGSVVDERALVAALRNQTILSAGLDVFGDEPNVPVELLAMEHIVLLPHVGSSTVYTRNAMGQLVVDNLVYWFSGRGPRTPVPETPWTAEPTYLSEGILGQLKA